MVKYNVWFKHFCVGKLYINEKEQYKYVTNIDTVEKAEMTERVLTEVKTDREWGGPISFFEFLFGDVNENNESYNSSYERDQICDEYYLIKDNY